MTYYIYAIILKIILAFIIYLWDTIYIMKNKINKGFRLGKKERIKLAIRKENLASIRSQVEEIRDTYSIYPMTSIYDKGFSFNGGKSKKCRFADARNF